MSWFTDIAGKAETFLNKIDQNAAVLVEAAAESDIFEPQFRKNVGKVETKFREKEKTVVVDLSPIQPIENSATSYSNNKHNRLTTSQLSNLATPQSSKPQVKQEVKNGNQSKATSNIQSQKSIDEELLQFLNEPTVPAIGEPKCDLKQQACDTTTENDKKETVQIVQSIIFNDILPKTRNGISESGSPKHDKIETEKVQGNNSIQDNFSNNHEVTMKINKLQQNGEEKKREVSQQNQALLDELASLTKELNRVEERAKQAEKECNTLRETLATKRTELRQRERRIQESVESTETAKKKTKELEAQIESLQNQLRLDQSRLDAANAQVKEKAEELEEEKKRSAEQIRRSQEAIHRTMKNLEDEITSLRATNESISVQVQMRELQINDLDSKWTASKEELKQITREHSEYKAKAKKVLLEKEKLISSFHETDSANGGTTAHRLDPAYSKAQLDQAIIERDLFREEAQQLTDRLNSLKQEMLRMESEYSREIEENRNKFREMELLLIESRNKQAKAETELKSREHEIIYLQEEMTRQKIGLSSKLKERENEVAELKLTNQRREAQSSPIPVTSSGEDASTSLESRISYLTETLLMKQALLETVAADKTALSLKVEKLENDLAEERRLLNGTGYDSAAGTFGTSGNLDTFYDKHHQLSNDGGRVRKAYTCLDKLSLRIGAMLRRYPMARIFVLVYMACLHLWVFFVLFHSTSDLTLPPAKR